MVLALGQCLPLACFHAGAFLYMTLADFAVAAFALVKSSLQRSMSELTFWLQKAANESKAAIEQALQGTDMVFVTVSIPCALSSEQPCTPFCC